MTVEGAHNEPLVDQKESRELKAGKIERVEDKTIGSYADLRVFLEEQASQARDLLTQKAERLKNDVDPKVMAEAVREANDKITEVMNGALQELTIASLRASCSQLSDIVGFELEIDESGLDQFGLDRRFTRRDAMEGIGFQSYLEENVTTGEKIHGALGFSERREEMRKNDTPMAEVHATMDIMKSFGTVEYVPYAKEGPVLVVLPEWHYGSEIIRDNLELMMQMRGRVALLASEGFEGEMLGQMEGGELKGKRDYYLNRISKNEVAISSSAVENVLGGEIRTVGVEREKTLIFVMNRIRQLVEKLEKEGLRDERLEALLGKIAASSSPRERLIYEAELLDIASAGFSKMAVYYRNQIWLGNIQRELVENRSSLSSSNNLVFLVCGALHADDLIKRAKHYGFKGAIRFIPKSLQETDMDKAALAYQQSQMKKK